MKHTELYPYQKEGVRDIHERFDGRSLLADEMGLGKTIQALFYAWKFLPAEPPGPVVIVVPATGKGNWRNQAAEHLGLYVTVLSKQRVPYRLTFEAGFDPDPNQIYVVNYDVLTQPRKKGDKERDESRSWWHWLRRQKPRLIIADEGHYLKNPDAARTRAFKKLVRGVKRVLILTGTPILNRPYELYPLVNAIRPDVFPSRLTFAWKFCDPVKKPWGWEFKGGTNLDELNELLLKTCMIRRLKKDVAGQMPPITWTVHPFDLDAADRREYDEAVADFLNWLTKISPTLAKRAANAEELVRIGYLRRLVGQLKVKHVIRWTEDFLENTDEKLLIFAQHRKVTYPIVDHFGRRAVLVDGDVVNQDREAAFAAVNDWKSGVDLGVMNWDAGGVVWSCRTASNAAFAEIPWTPGQLAQAAARIHGAGRGVPGSPAFAHLLVARNTFDDRMCRVQQEKQKVLDQTLDGGSGVGMPEVYELFKQELLKEQNRAGVTRG